MTVKELNKNIIQETENELSLKDIISRVKTETYEEFKANELYDNVKNNAKRYHTYTALKIIENLIDEELK